MSHVLSQPIKTVTAAVSPTRPQVQHQLSKAAHWEQRLPVLISHNISRKGIGHINILGSSRAFSECEVRDYASHGVKHEASLKSNSDPISRTKCRNPRAGRARPSHASWLLDAAIEMERTQRRRHRRQIQAVDCHVGRSTGTAPQPIALLRQTDAMPDAGH